MTASPRNTWLAAWLSRHRHDEDALRQREQAGGGRIVEGGEQDRGQELHGVLEQPGRGPEHRMAPMLAGQRPEPPHTARSELAPVAGRQDEEEQHEPEHVAEGIADQQPERLEAGEAEGDLQQRLAAELRGASRTVDPIGALPHRPVLEDRADGDRQRRRQDHSIGARAGVSIQRVNASPISHTTSTAAAA